MTTSGVDYSWARPDPQELADLGHQFACRYVSWDDTGKNLTRSELETLSDAGIAVVLNWEYYADAAMGGWSQGVNDATGALDQANDLGCPQDCPIYFSVDFDMTLSQVETVGEYFAGIASVLPLDRIGIYGSYDAVSEAINRDWAHWYWQTFAWSGGQVHPQVHIYQHTNNVQVAGGAVDLNDAYVDDIGAWGLADDVEQPPATGLTAAGVWEYPIASDVVLPASAALTDTYMAVTQDLPASLATIQFRLDEIYQILTGTVPEQPVDPCEQHLRTLIVDELRKFLPASPSPGRHRGES
jgi:hypothetical protein